MIPAIGYSLCGAHSRRLPTANSLDPHPNALEVDLESLSNGLNCLRDRRTQRVTLHAESLSPAAEERDAALAHLAELAETTGAQAVIARLADAETRTGENAALPASRDWKTESAELCRQVESLQSRLGTVPFYLEAAVEAEWFKRTSHGKRVMRKVLSGTGCGWFLDVTALYVAAMNSAQDACDLLEEVLPSADRVQLRLTGVFFDEKAERWIASDAHPIPEAVYELYAFVLEVAFEKVDAVFVRQNRARGKRSDSATEIRTVREIAEGVSAIV